jgi:hypothetical protein
LISQGGFLIRENSNNLNLRNKESDGGYEILESYSRIFMTLGDGVGGSFFKELYPKMSH